MFFELHGNGISIEEKVGTWNKKKQGWGMKNFKEKKYSNLQSFKMNHDALIKLLRHVRYIS